MSKLHLILAFHNHQPVGNFEHVLEDSYRKSYLPFLETLLDHPRLKVVLHYSGHLLSWIQKRHPDAFDMIKTLVGTKRVELLSGGFYEPILSVLPEKDRSLQIEELSLFIKKNLGYTPKGIWLAERIWEPQMPRFIAKANIEYLPVDDYHFTLTGLEEKDLLGYYITEDEGRSISVFPGSEKLRYLIPFKTVDEVISYLREISVSAESPLLTMADDGEKFGVWPDTYKHVYEGRWLDTFLTAIENNSDWIETTTFREYHSKFRPLGLIYLPTASYREMGEWALPSSAGREYEYALSELEKIIGEKSKRLLRGGIWRSFMVKYPEANHIHKRMVMVSGKVHRACAVNEKKGHEALAQLWKGQCNDAYWHGVFGGLYIPHLRSALYRHLIRAESQAAAILKEYPSIDRCDFDHDGYEDIVVSTKHFTLTVSEKGGALTELSLYRQAVNICDTLSRRPEAYHAKITGASSPSKQEIKTIHDRLSVKEENLAGYLIYDDYRRSSLIDHFLPASAGISDLASGLHKELGDFVSGTYALNYAPKGDEITLSLSRDGMVRGNRVKIEKIIGLAGKKIHVEYLIDGRFSGLFAIEMNVSLLGSALSVIRTEDKELTMRSTAEYNSIREFGLRDSYLNLAVDFEFSENIRLWHYPVDTVSLSEEGVERVYQGTAFLFVKEMDLKGREKVKFSIQFGENEE
jgi:hypothetical protein